MPNGDLKSCYSQKHERNLSFLCFFSIFQAFKTDKYHSFFQIIMGSQSQGGSEASSGGAETFCLKFNDFQANLTSAFNELREESDLLDTSIICDNGGQVIRAHKLVLSASSAVFRQLFRNVAVNKSSNEPMIFLLDVKAEDFRALLDFMYEGQVNVAHENLNEFLALAEKLQIRGLTSNNNVRSTTNNKRLIMNENENPANKRTRFQHLETMTIKEEHKVDSNEPLFHHSGSSTNSIVPSSAYHQQTFSQPFAYENNELQEQQQQQNGDSSTNSNQAFTAVAATPQPTPTNATQMIGPGEDFSINPQTLVDHKGNSFLNSLK